jgi:hypothetical protein
MGGVSVVLLTAVIAVGAGALGHRFRLFSRVAAAEVLSTGAATFLYAPRMIDQLPTPGVGIIERFALYGFLIWSAVLAGALIRHALQG